MREAGSGKGSPSRITAIGPSKRSCIAHPPDRGIAPWRSKERNSNAFYQRPLPPSQVHWGDADESPFAFKGSKTCSFQSYSQDRLACAFGALTFAGLAFAAALYPLI